jgi:hypothetical protein
MKILFITNASGPDYMSDMVFHGGKMSLVHDFYESTKMWYMYDDITNKETLYGRGFTMYGKIPANYNLPLLDNVITLINNKFFDKIIYGSIWRCNHYFDIVSKIYDKNDIIFIDGEDTELINYTYLNKGKYFKREYNDNIEGVYPINFCVPKELILSRLINKDKIISDIVPNFNKNYSFVNENDYYNEYARSWYAHTQKKGGWDCLRHYEIMMNGCLPIFNDLENCPKNTLTFIPKKEIIEFGKSQHILPENNEFILNHMKNNLTTKHIFNYIL